MTSSDRRSVQERALARRMVRNIGRVRAGLGGALVGLSVLAACAWLGSGSHDVGWGNGYSTVCVSAGVLTIASMEPEFPHLQFSLRKGLGAAERFSEPWHIDFRALEHQNLAPGVRDYVLFAWGHQPKASLPLPAGVPRIRLVLIVFWPIPVLLLAAGLPLLWIGIRGIRRSRAGLCSRCGYDIRGLGENEQCPECGG